MKRRQNPTGGDGLSISWSNYLLSVPNFERLFDSIRGTTLRCSIEISTVRFSYIKVGCFIPKPFN